MKYVNYKGMKVPIDPPLRENMGALVGMKAGDYMAGVNSPIPYEVVLADFDWRPFIFSPDKQWYPTFDTFACTNFASSNSRKLQLKQSTGEEYNFSERAMAVLSGTQPGVGNYMQNDSEWVRKNGIILDKDWPNDDGANSVNDFYKPVSKEALSKAIKVKENFEFIDTTRASITYHLKQAPSNIIIKAGATNHDVCAVFVDSNGIWYYDSYANNDPNNYLAITTQVPLAALKIITKPMNTVYFVHKKGTGEYGLLSQSPVGQQYVPASTEADLKARGGIAVPLKPDGSVDFSQAREIDLP